MLLPSSFSEFDVVDAETRRVMQSRVNSSVRRNYEMHSTLRDVVTDQWHHGRCKEKGVAEPTRRRRAPWPPQGEGRGGACKVLRWSQQGKACGGSGKEKEGVMATACMFVSKDVLYFRDFNVNCKFFGVLILSDFNRPCAQTGRSLHFYSVPIYTSIQCIPNSRSIVHISKLGILLGWTPILGILQGRFWVYFVCPKT